MRRTLAIATFTALSLAACGNDPDSTPVSLPPAEGQTESTEPAEPEDLCIPEGGEVPEPDLGGAEPPEPNPDKPEVEVPEELPTALERNVLVEGEGEPAEVGDTVVVDYTGVRSTDGLPFDNSYDGGQPFPVVVGQGEVIQGWDDGLLGVQTGERVQLDIPSDQAYGENARSNIICENQDLSFVIDVRAVIKPADPADAPTEPGVELSGVDGEPGVDDTVFEDLTEGDGETLEVGDTAVIRYVNFRGDNGVLIESNWATDALQVPYGDNLLLGLLEGMDGMQVGGRRAVTIPPEDGFGVDGNPQGGLPADTDMIFVIDLIGKY